jgi:hypothetical protein
MSDLDIEKYFNDPSIPVLQTLKRYIEYDLQSSLSDIANVSVSHVIVPEPVLPDEPMSWDELLEYSKNHLYNDPMDADIALSFCNGQTFRLEYSHQSGVIVGVNIE